VNRSVALQAAAAFLLFGFLYWAALVWPVLPFGSRLFTGLGMVLPLGTLFGLILAATSIADMRGRSRPSEIRGLVLGLAVIAGTVVGLWFGPSHRMERIARVTEAAMTLVGAIDEFERREGRPPPQLSELVPKYLSEIPATGMGGYPDWEYRTGVNARPYAENPWVLVIPAGGPGINFDQLLYFPNQRYPASGYGGRLERVGRWAYVHE
jgi:MFS family permease